MFITIQTVYYLLSPQRAGYSIPIKNFLSAFDFTLLEFRFFQLNDRMATMQLVDEFIPLRAVYGETLTNIYGMYYNTIVANILAKVLIWAGFFGITYPISLVARRLLGSDSENMYAWPDKYFFSGTMMIFFTMQ
jgi:hypothetical protein